MSSLKLLHSGGNGVIISAPSSNPAANRTITLNDNYAGDGSFVTANSSGDVGIGTSTPSSYDSYARNLVLAGDTHTGMTIKSSGGTTGNIYFADGTSGGAQYAGWLNYNHSSNTTTLGTNGSERMRLDSDGGLRVGNTTNIFNTAATEKVSIKQSSQGNALTLQTTNISGGFPILYMYSSDSTASQNAIVFWRSGSVGTITTSASSTAYNTSSDYRLKENEVAISDGITRLKTLKPYRFNWKVDPDTKVDGFFAHEVTAVPEAVTGTKDQVSTDENGAIPKGEPIYQGIDQSKLVPLLTAALQEEIAKREALEARVAALEAA